MNNPLDITSEADRTYHYAGDQTFTIHHPEKLHITETGSHRVIAQGRTYRPERGWLAISWQPRDGEPPFVA